MSRLGSLLCFVLITGVSVAITPPALATFPGGNGKLFFAGNQDGDFEIYAVAANDTGLVQLTHNSLNDEDPSVSANGKLVYWDQEQSNGNRVLMVMHADGSNQHALTSKKKDSWMPAPGPDGTIAFAREGGNGYSQIYTMAPNGSQLRQLTDTGRGADEPAWSPNGKIIAFTRSYHFYSAIFTMNTAGRRKTAITPADADYYDPSFSPDGQRIAVDSDLSGKGTDIYTMAKNGSDITPVTDVAGAQVLPHYSPDGADIAYSTDADGDFDVVWQPLVGSVNPVANDTATDYMGSWQST